MEPDFSGYATKAGLKCSDGRTIMPEAFQHMDGITVPLVWQHGHNDAGNVLGHAILEARKDGVYCNAFFNDTTQGKNAKALVQHGDITSLSIYANKLVEKGKSVFHGVIREVSLVLSGANPGALIDNVSVAHSDGEVDYLEDEAVIYTGLKLEHSENSDEEEDENVEHADTEDDNSDDNSDETVQDVYDTLTDKQKNVVNYMIGAALEEKASADNSASHSDDEDDEDEGDLNHQEGNDDMSRNVFDQTGNAEGQKRQHLTHDQLTTIVEDAQKMGSFKESLLAHADEYGIGNIEMLFPDAKAVQNSPDFVKRRSEWVSSVISGTKHSPFSRIKSVFADITADEARAKGYIKGSLKKEEFFALAQRSTTPTTVYKKQKLDRNDILDITDLDVVAWLKAEMRIMLDEEIAGAVLFGDGREVDDPDKVKDPEGASSGEGIRSVAHDAEFYAPVKTLDSTATDYTPDELVDLVVDAMADYEGSGSPTLYTTLRTMNKILLQKDSLGRRIYANRSEVAQLMGVGSIVDVPDSVIGRAEGVVGVIVNLSDYTLGTDKGGEVNFFDDFDIDYNQFKYLMEGRSSGALTKYHSAIILKDVPAEAPPAG